MTEAAYLNVGDVFFANTTFEFAYRVIGRDPKSQKYVKGVTVLQVSDQGSTGVSASYVKGYDPNTGRAIMESTNDHEMFSKQRVGKEYVVESVKNLAPSERDGIRSEPEVIARRLNKDGTYDPKGELIRFVDAPRGTRSNYSTAASVLVHRKMTRKVTFV